MDKLIAVGFTQNFPKNPDFLKNTLQNTTNNLTELTEQGKASIFETTDKAKEAVAGATNKAVVNLAETSDQLKISVSEVTNKAVNTVAATTNQAISAINETTEKAKGSLSEVTNIAISSVTDTAEKAKENLAQTTNMAIHSVTESASNAVTTVTNTAEKAKATLTETASNTITSVDLASNQVIESINTSAERAKASLDSTIDQAENLTKGASNAFEKAFTSLITDWGNSHPIIMWFVSHPLITLGLIILFIILIAGFIKAIGNFIQQGWLFVLTAPFKIFPHLFTFGKLGSQGLMASLATKSLSESDYPERAKKIISRLDEIKQEQESLIQELASFVSVKELK